MLDILSITGPIFITIGVGYVFTRFRVFSASDVVAMSKFVATLALPALLFAAIARREVSSIFMLEYMLPYGVGTFTLLVFVLFYLMVFRNKALTEAAADTLGAASPNTGFVGYPILLLTFPGIAGHVLAMNFLIENLVIIPTLLILAELGRQNAVGVAAAIIRVVMQTVKNPIVIGVVLGLAASISGVALPGPVNASIDLFAKSATAVALLVIGGSLVGQSIKGIRLRLLRIVFGKLFLHPLFVFAAIVFLPVLGLGHMSDEYSTAAILMAGMPIMGIYVVLAQRYGHGGIAAVAQISTTVLSFFTLTALLYVLQ